MIRPFAVLKPGRKFLERMDVWRVYLEGCACVKAAGRRGGYQYAQRRGLQLIERSA